MLMPTWTLPGDGQVECKHLVASLGRKLPAIHIQRDVLLVGIHFDLRGILRPLGVAPAAKVDKGLGAEICLVNVESVFLDLAVKGDQTFLILAGLAALVAAIRAEIKAVPAVHGPDIGPLRPHFQHMFVIKCLITFCPVAFFRLSALVLGIGVRAVFGEADDSVRVLCVEIIEPLVVLLGVAHIPAVIEVV